MPRLPFLIFATAGLMHLAPQAPPKPSLLRVLANDYTLATSTQPRSGMVTIRLVNLGREMHMVDISPVPDSVTLRRFYELATGAEPSPLVRDIGGPNLTPPGDSSEVTLALGPGRYVLTCWVNTADGKPHIMRGMMSEVRIIGGTATLAPPRASVVVTASDYAFNVRGQFRAGDNTVAFENSGPQEHDIQFVRLARGETIGLIQRWAERGGVGSPSHAVVGGSSGLAQGEHTWFTLHLRPGRYAMFCWVPDARDGKMHLLHGMVREISVS